MATYQPLVEESELKYDIYQAFVSGMLRTFYLVYDELTDELIIKFVNPKSVASVYHKGNYFGLLIAPDTGQVVGFEFFMFQTYHLPHWNELKKVWYKEKLAKHFSSYQEVKFIPKKKQEIKTPDYIYGSATDVLCSALI
jgi:hypothetical protein